MTHKASVYIILIILTLPWGCSLNSNKEIEEDYSQVFEKYGVEGVFALYDDSKNTTYITDLEKFEVQHIPGSTFKIFNSLIALETGTLKDENEKLLWDSSLHFHKSWNKDSDLKDALENSTTWFFQECTRRIGQNNIKKYLDKLDYGNRDTSGGIENFWREGGLKISPKQQIQFINNLLNADLPLSKRSQLIVYKNMNTEEHASYSMKAITGWVVENSEDIGWYVGCVQKGEKSYVFVNCIQAGDSDFKKFTESRKDIAIEIMRAKGILPDTSSNSKPIKVSSF
jgi:beta-lactamase class D